MKSLQETFQKQLNEATEKAEKQQATINFLKTEMERKSKMIRDLQNENKSLKNKLLSGNKLCGIHAEESKKIQAQLKELRYGKKDLIFKNKMGRFMMQQMEKAQQLTDLEQKLAIAKEELEKAALDKAILGLIKYKNRKRKLKEEERKTSNNPPYSFHYKDTSDVVIQVKLQQD
ncbi:PREDICTED: leucine zipper protein 2-like [Thamnophis sirtalis]|uniref:Leucine zipper protein 2-like n=1 Tax=Thamnophis sirtalis TaxID=35019 RepID=A0A6I9X490_9SAUR|nr:PREDICTED: leucine zipper protein 2-like [Thamnophis sirtalis]